MKNTKTKLGSFADAKLQANSRWLLAITLVALIGFSMAACATTTAATTDTATVTYFGDTWSLSEDAVTLSSSAWSTLAGQSAPTREGLVSIGTKNKADSLSVVIANSALNATKVTGAKMADIVAWINDSFSGGARTDILNKLRNDGYCIIGVNIGADDILTIAIFTD